MLAPGSSVCRALRSLVTMGKMVRVMTLTGNFPWNWCGADSSRSWPLLFLQPASVLGGWDQREKRQTRVRRGGGRGEEWALKIYDPPVPPSDTVVRALTVLRLLDMLHWNWNRLCWGCGNESDFPWHAVDEQHIEFGLRDSDADILTVYRDSQHILYRENIVQAGRHAHTWMQHAQQCTDILDDKQHVNPLWCWTLSNSCSSCILELQLYFIVFGFVPSLVSVSQSKSPNLSTITLHRAAPVSWLII